MSEKAKLYRLVSKIGERDGNGKPPDNGGMESRVIKLEDFAQDTRERLTRIETRLENTATKTDVAELRIEMHKIDASIKTWMIGTVLAMMIGFGGLFMSMNKSTVAAQQAPIIINIPAQPAPPPVK